MKTKIIFLAAGLIMSFAAFSQNQYTARRIIALDSFYLKNAWLIGLTTSPSLASSKPAQEVPNTAAVISYVAAQIAASGGGFNNSTVTTTTNNTANVQIPVTDFTIGTIEAEVKGISPGGYAIIGRKVVKYEKSGGTLTILGVTAEVFPTSKKLLNAADFDFEINTTTQGFQVVCTGETGIQISWKVTWKANSHSN